MKRQMHYVVRSEFVRGLSTLLDVSTPVPARKLPRRNQMQSLRNDMAKIGGDFYRVIERERANEKASHASDKTTAAK